MNKVHYRLSQSVYNHRQAEFRRAFNINFYIWCTAFDTFDDEWEDFKLAYLMGGEL